MFKWIETLGKKRFVSLAILLSFIGDILLLIYIKEKFSNFDRFKEMFIKTTGDMGVNPIDLPPDFINEQFYLVQQAITLMLVLYIIFQIIHYALYYVEKKYGIKYFFSMNIVALVLAPLLVISELVSMSKWGPIFLIQTLFFLICFLGHRFYFRGKEQPNANP